MKRNSHIRLASASLLLLIAGCMLPPYHTQSGYSSTYHEHLNRDEENIIWLDSNDEQYPQKQENTERNERAAKGVFFPKSLEFETKVREKKKK